MCVFDRQMSNRRLASVDVCGVFWFKKQTLYNDQGFKARFSMETSQNSLLGVVYQLLMRKLWQMIFF